MALLSGEKHGGKIFSSANLVLILMFLTFLSTYVYKMSVAVHYYPLFFQIIFLIIAFSFGIALYIKAPLFVKKQKFSEVDETCKWELSVSKSLGWLASFSVAMLTFEPSYFVSFFSGIKINFFSSGRICKFTLEEKAVKGIHRFLDFVLLLILTPMVYLITNELFYLSWKLGFFIFMMSVFLYFRREIIYTFFSLNIGKSENAKINVIYPYSTLRSRYRLYGYTNQFKNMVFITEKTFKANQVMKDYVIAHELGHLKDKKRIILHKMFFLVLLVFLTVVPFCLDEVLAFIPLLLFFLYNSTVGRLISEKVEFTADKYALKKLGKKSCLEALSLMSKENANASPPIALFSNYISLNRRIKFINDYNEEES